jgi:hypothetical protein
MPPDWAAAWGEKRKLEGHDGLDVYLPQGHTWRA